MGREGAFFVEGSLAVACGELGAAAYSGNRKMIFDLWSL